MDNNSLSFSPTPPSMPVASSRRLVIIVVAIIAFVALAGLGWWWYGSSNRNNTKNTNTTATQVDISDPTGTPLNANIAVAGANLQFVSVIRTKEYRGQTAAADKEFIAVTFAPLSGSGTEVAKAAEQAKLTSDQDVLTPRLIYVSSVKDTEANGTIAFEVPTGRTEFTLQLGSTSLPLTVPQ